VQPHEVNGQPGAIFRDRDGNVVNTWAFDILDGQIQAIRTVLNPDKLRHLGPVADGWAVLREAGVSRQPAEWTTEPRYLVLLSSGTPRYYLVVVSNTE
jgi:RNA polymerase sigma-70 factor, ECF subfamily